MLYEAGDRIRGSGRARALVLGPVDPPGWYAIQWRHGERGCFWERDAPDLVSGPLSREDVAAIWQWESEGGEMG